MTAAELVAEATTVRCPHCLRTFDTGDPFRPLTPGLVAVTALLSTGLSNQEIAETRQMTLKSVEHYATTIYHRLGFANRRCRSPRVMTALWFLEKRPEAAPDPYPLAAQVHLSPREEQLLALISEGWSNTYIADRLFVSKKSLENYIHYLYVHLQISGAHRSGARVRAMLWWRTLGKTLKEVKNAFTPVP